MSSARHTTPKLLYFKSLIRARYIAFAFGTMTQQSVNVPGDKDEFDPERWTSTTSQNGDKIDSRLPKRYPETGIDVLIVGAGMGGLMTVLECWRKGHNVVRILERNQGPVYSGSYYVACLHGENDCG